MQFLKQELFGEFEEEMLEITNPTLPKDKDQKALDFIKSLWEMKQTLENASGNLFRLSLEMGACDENYVIMAQSMDEYEKIRAEYYLLKQEILIFVEEYNKDVASVIQSTKNRLDAALA